MCTHFSHTHRQFSVKFWLISVGTGEIAIQNLCSKTEKRKEKKRLKSAFAQPCRMSSMITFLTKSTANP